MEPIARKPIVNLVADRIVEYIRANTLAVDSKLPTEQSFCTQLNVSRSSLREAYRLLHAQGVLTIKPGKGAFVSDPDLRSETAQRTEWLSQNKLRYLDLIEVRSVLETFAARVAAERITEDQIFRLKQNLDEFQENMYKPDRYQLLADLDEQFHELIFNGSQNSFLIDINNLISRKIKTFRYAIMKMEERRENTYIPHLKIYLAIKERNADLSIQAMEDHLRLAELDMVELANEQKDSEQ